MTTPEQPDMVEAAFVPGVFRCAKCGFQLIQSNLNATDGMITARDAPGDKCPNDGSPMWRVSWREYAIEQIEGYDRLISEKDAEITALQSTPNAEGELRELDDWRECAVELPQQPGTYLTIRDNPGNYCWNFGHWNGEVWRSEYDADPIDPTHWKYLGPTPSGERTLADPLTRIDATLGESA